MFEVELLSLFQHLTDERVKITDLKEEQGSSGVWLPLTMRALEEGERIEGEKISPLYLNVRRTVPRARNQGDAVVRVLRAGLCASDLHSYHGLELGLAKGTTRGHEFVGQVVELYSSSSS